MTTDSGRFFSVVQRIVLLTRRSAALVSFKFCKFGFLKYFDRLL